MSDEMRPNCRNTAGLLDSGKAGQGVSGEDEKKKKRQSMSFRKHNIQLVLIGDQRALVQSTV